MDLEHKTFKEIRKMLEQHPAGHALLPVYDPFIDFVARTLSESSTIEPISNDETNEIKIATLFITKEDKK